MALRHWRAPLLTLLGLALVGLILLSSGVIRTKSQPTRTSVQFGAIPPTTTPTRADLGWWSTLPTPRLIPTWESTATLTQTKNP